jgi:hypothetical protein
MKAKKSSRVNIEENIRQSKLKETMNQKKELEGKLKHLNLNIDDLGGSNKRIKTITKGGGALS